MPQPKIIDVWMQHPTPKFIQHPMFDSLRRWTGQLTEPDVPLEFTINAMDAAGITQGLLAAWHGPQGELITNQEVADAIAAHPTRFKGLASVDLHHPMKAIHQLRHCINDLGFIGLRIIPWLWNLPPNDRRYYPLYAECCQLDIPFCTQVGHTGPLAPSEPGRPIPYLDQVALDFPELKIVAGHIGVPWLEEMISLTTKYPNLYIDTSAYKTKRYPPQLIDYLKTHGQKKVLFGTNYPMILPKDALADLHTLNLDPKTQQHFLHKNAQQIFKLQ